MNQIPSIFEISVQTLVYKPEKFNEEVIPELILQIKPPIPNVGYSTVDVELTFTLSKQDDEIVCELKSSELFEFKYFENNEEFQKSLRQAIKQSYIGFCNKIENNYFKKGYLLNPMRACFINAINELYSPLKNLNDVFSCLYRGT